MANLRSVRSRMTMAVACTVASLAGSVSVAQVAPPARKPAHVEIVQGPALESARDGVAIIRWITTNPGGLDDHLAVVHYGPDPQHLDQVAKNSIRLNRNHPETVFRARLAGLKPRTTYYYKATSFDSSGASDGVESSVKSFTTPAAGEYIDNPIQSPRTSR